MILAIETATDICSVALQDDTGTIFEKRADAHGSHSEKLFQFIGDMMKEQEFAVEDLSGVLISQGPGSYTGLRIAASGVKGLLFGSDIPLYSVSTLASFAASALESGSVRSRIHAIIDARREHVYHQLFRVKEGALTAESAVATVPIESLERRVEAGDTMIGTGIDRLERSIIADITTMGMDSISARSLVSLNQRPEGDHFLKKVSPALFDPKYYSSRQVQ